jgi:hypothetical protein
MHQGRLFLPHLLCGTGFQIIQLLREASAEFVQKGLLPSSRGVLCAEEVIDLLGHLIEDRDAFAFCPCMPSTSSWGIRVISVLQVGENRDSPHVSQVYQGPLATQPMGQRQVIAQRVG